MKHQILLTYNIPGRQLARTLRRGDGAERLDFIDSAQLDPRSDYEIMVGHGQTTERKRTGLQSEACRLSRRFQGR